VLAFVAQAVITLIIWNCLVLTYTLGHRSTNSAAIRIIWGTLKTLKFHLASVANLIRMSGNGRLGLMFSKLFRFITDIKNLQAIPKGS
jgi:hypothetical protein